MKFTRANKSSPTQPPTNDEAFSADILSGLSSTPKHLSSKYFYDDLGSQLFQKITAHEDYYPTRKELEIFEQIQHHLPTLFHAGAVEIIELGVGDGHKTRLLLEGFLQAGHEVRYTPIDISEQAMALLENNLPQHNSLQVEGIVGDYIDALRHINKETDRQRIVLFLGSNIGNFDLPASKGFLHRVRAHLNTGDHLLIGFDLKKDISILTKAYNDSAGFTREFNLNLLRRINREFDADFDVSHFDHVGIYNPVLGAMESYLIATRKQEVKINALDASFTFSPYEPIHTEYSFKYHEDDIEGLCQAAGFSVVQHFSDAQRYFMDSLWQAS
ncbi:MAG: L-histidine N(alpha)-methyltransferase [Halioglobus sp.]